MSAAMHEPRSCQKNRGTLARSMPLMRDGMRYRRNSVPNGESIAI